MPRRETKKQTITTAYLSVLSIQFGHFYSISSFVAPIQIASDPVHSDAVRIPQRGLMQCLRNSHYGLISLPNLDSDTDSDSGLRFQTKWLHFYHVQNVHIAQTQSRIPTPSIPSPAMYLTHYTHQHLAPPQNSVLVVKKL